MVLFLPPKRQRKFRKNTPEQFIQVILTKDLQYSRPWGYSEETHNPCCLGLGALLVPRGKKRLVIFSKMTR